MERSRRKRRDIPENKTFNLLSDNKVCFNYFHLIMCLYLFYYLQRDPCMIFSLSFCLYSLFTYKNQQIKWVEQQHVLERDKRSVVPEYIPTVHPEAYIIRDPLFSQQWYLVSFYHIIMCLYLVLIF